MQVYALSHHVHWRKRRKYSAKHLQFKVKYHADGSEVSTKYSSGKVKKKEEAEGLLSKFFGGAGGSFSTGGQIMNNSQAGEKLELG